MALGNDLSLLLRIKGDSSDAVAALNRTTKETKELDNVTKGLGASLSSSVNPSAIAAAAITAVGAAAIATARALFDLTVASAEYGAQIFDAKEKTGLTTETLSALRFAADQSGSSLDEVTNASARFAKTVGDAANGSEKAQAKLERLGVTSKDLDTALGQALKTIVNLPPGIEQMTAAQDAFGRSGANLLPFIKSFDGDLAALTQKAKALGVTLSDEDARAADEFSDTLDTLKAQAQALGFQFTKGLMKDITSSMQDISASLAQNREAVEAWGESVRQTLSGLKNISTDLYEFSQTPAGRALSLLLFGTFNALSGVNQLIQQAASPPSVPQAPPVPTTVKDFLQQQEENRKNRPGATLDFSAEDDEEAKKAAEKRRKEREAAFKKELADRARGNQLMLQGERETFQQIQQEWEDAFLNREKTEDDFVKASVANITLYRDKVKALIENAFQIDSAGKSGIELQNAELEKNNALLALNREISREASDVRKAVESQRKEDARNKEKDDKEEKRRQEQADRDKEQALEDYNALYRELLELQKESREAERQITNIIAERTRRELQTAVRNAPTAPDRNASLLVLRDFEIAEATRKEKLNQEDLEREKNAAIARLDVAQLEAGQREAIEEAYRLKALESEEEFQSELAEIRAAAAEEFVVTELGFFESLELALESLGEHLSILDLARDAFQQLGQAIGSVVQQYVLYGRTAPGVLRQVLAATLASIAAQAAVEAIKAAAYGLLFLALGQYDAAAFAFGSAALWGSIAIGAALLGRAIAPKQNNAASSAFSSSASRSSGTSIDNRDASNQGKVFSGFGDKVFEDTRSINDPSGRGNGGILDRILTIRIKDDSRFLGDALEYELTTNGRSRKLVQEMAVDA